MYVNAKMIPVETVPGIRGEGMGESDGESEFKYDVFDIHCKNLCKCFNVPLPSITIKKNYKKKN
jgi:hypothetical protein